MKVLTRLTGLGMNVVMVIHQPRFEIYECFDSVLLLAAGGLAGLLCILCPEIPSQSSN